ncbi:MAG: hypothetical protein ACOVOR_04970 [Rhabdochlamydiaceae bacterium]
MASALKHVKHLFPINSEAVRNMQEDDLAWIELLINRFGKLQDLIGSKIIDVFLEKHEESVSHLTVLDKLHRLEKLEIIEDTELWKEMRKARNHLDREYPDNPEIMAKYMNQIFNLAPKLLSILSNLKKRM